LILLKNIYQVLEAGSVLTVTLELLDRNRLKLSRHCFIATFHVFNSLEDSFVVSHILYGLAEDISDILLECEMIHVLASLQSSLNNI
jgi:hypothetical protein